MRVGVAAVPLLAVALGGDPMGAVARPPGPPPLAFRNVTLNTPLREIDVHMQSMEELPIRVRISRRGQVVGTGGGDVQRGQSIIRVRLGPKMLARLRPGQHVALRIAYGAPEPLYVPNAVLGKALDLTL